jgi:flagellar motor switch protein FliM
MPEGLSHEEVAALHEALRQGELGPGRGGRRVRQYDFRMPDKFSKDQLRAITHLYDGMARTLVTTLSAYLRASVQIQAPVVEQATYADFIRSLPDPAVLGVVELAPLGSALLQIDSELALPMIDRLLGGPGQHVGMNRALTDIEAVVASRVINSILDNVREAWRHVADLRPRLDAVETNPLFVQLAGGGDVVLVVILEAEMGSHSGAIRFCLPYVTLEPVLGRLRARQWYEAARRDRTGDRHQVLSGLLGVHVRLTVELGHARLTVRRLRDLQPGDLVRLDTGPDDPVTVQIGGAAKFLARPGRVGRRLGVEIVGTAP